MIVRFIRVLAQGIDTVAAFLALAAIALTCWEAAVRYLAPRYAVDWGTDLIIFLLVWATFLMSARAAYENRHVAATVVVDLLPGPVRRALFLFSIVVGLGFGFILFLYGWDVVAFASMLNIKSDSSLRYPLAWYYLILPVSGFLLCSGYLLRLWLFARHDEHRLPPAHSRTEGQDP